MPAMAVDWDSEDVGSIAGEVADDGVPIVVELGACPEISCLVVCTRYVAERLYH